MSNFLSAKLLLSFRLFFIILDDNVFSFKLHSSKDVYTVVNGEAKIPCNISFNNRNELLLILWYKNSDAIGPPIYSLDFREKSPKHFLNDSLKDRAQFKLSTEPPFLLLSPIKPEDEGIYYCRVDYKWSRTESSSIYLNVAVPPKKMYIIDNFGQMVYAITEPYEEDLSLNITCVAKNGKPAPRLLWYFNDMLIDKTFTIKKNVSSNSFQNFTTVENVLSISRLERSYFNSVLTCQAVNVYYLSLPLSTSIRINMLLKPAGVSITFVKMPLIENKRIDVVCKTWGSKPRSKIVWFLKDKELKRTKLIHNLDGNSSTSTLTFIPSFQDNGYHLICKSFNPKLKKANEIQATLFLEVLYKPKVSLQVAGDIKYAIKGNAVILKCLVDANPFANAIEWFYQQKVIESSPDIVLKNYSLLILNTTLKHQGKYSCKVSNSQGITFSQPFYLNTFYAPKCKMSNLETSYHLTIGQNFSIQCLVDAHPTNDVLFEWFHTSSKFSKNQTFLTNYTSQEGESWLYLNLRSIDNFGYFYCSARNIAGQQVQPCVFVIKPIYELPKVPKKCQMFNESYYLLIKCESGDDVLADQLYYLEMYETQKSKLILLLKEKLPQFKVELKNQSIQHYFFIIYSKNYFGKSDFLNISIQPETRLMLNRILNITSSEKNLFKNEISYILALLFFGFVIISILISKRVRKRCQKKKNNILASNEVLSKKKQKGKENTVPNFSKPLEIKNLKTPDLIVLSNNSLNLYDKGSTICQTNRPFLNHLNDNSADLVLTEINEISNSNQSIFYVTTLV